MKYIFIAEIKDEDCDTFRCANLLTWADVALRQLPNGNYEVIKGSDEGTTVRSENIGRLTING